eukprot:13691567-Heterocapsa_arctica.AAC.1
MLDEEKREDIAEGLGPGRPAQPEEKGEDLGDAMRSGSGRLVPKLPPQVPAPTDVERARHELSHVPYAAWCGTCVEGRGRDEPHRSAEPHGHPT